METKDPLWFEIDDAFAVVEDQCLRARAAELVLQQRRLERELVQAKGAASKASPAVEKAHRPDRYAKASELAKDMRFREEHPDGANLEEMRQVVRARLHDLRLRIGAVLSERDAYSALFPFVVYCDELAALATRGAVKRWEPMQGELYEVEDGGERFYDYLDEALRQEATHPLVFEIYYFCLLDGFRGKLPAGSNQIEDYKARALARVRPADIQFPQVSVEPKRPELAAFPWRYYAAAAALVILVFVVLSVFAGA